MLCCAQLCQCFLSHPVANPHSRSIAPNRPTFAQRQQCGLDHTNQGLLRDLQFLSVFMCNRALGTVWCAFCRPPHLPKVPRDRPSVFFYILKCKSRSHYSPVMSCALFVDNFAGSSPAAAETETLLRRPQEPHYTKKAQGFAPESVFTREVTLSRSVTLRYIGYILITRTALAHYKVVPHC